MNDFICLHNKKSTYVFPFEYYTRNVLTLNTSIEATAKNIVQGLPLKTWQPDLEALLPARGNQRKITDLWMEIKEMLLV